MSDQAYEPKHAEEQKTHPLLSDNTYNRLKWFTLIVLPAIGTLYFGVAHIWDLPKADEVSATVTAMVLFLGTILGISTKTYNQSDQKFDGSINVQEGDTSKLFSLTLNSDPDELEKKDQVIFKVNSN